jgi:hypothetical protein
LILIGADSRDAKARVVEYLQGIGFNLPCGDEPGDIRVMADALEQLAAKWQASRNLTRRMSWEEIGSALVEDKRVVQARWSNAEAVVQQNGAKLVQIDLDRIRDDAEKLQGYLRQHPTRPKRRDAKSARR